MTAVDVSGGAVLTLDQDVNRTYLGIQYKSGIGISVHIDGVLIRTFGSGSTDKFWEPDLVPTGEIRITSVITGVGTVITG